MKFSIEIDVPLGDEIASARLSAIRAILAAIDRGVTEGHADNRAPLMAAIIEDLEGVRNVHHCEHTPESTPYDIAKALADVERELRSLLDAGHAVKLRLYDMGPAE